MQNLCISGPTKKNTNEVPLWYSDALKVMLLPEKISIFLPKTAIFAPTICTFGHFGANVGFAGSPGVLLVDWLLVVGRGLLL